MGLCIPIQESCIFKTYRKINYKMINGINYITDESGNNKAIILDLIRFKKDGIKAEVVIEALANLQQLIDNAPIESKTSIYLVLSLKFL